jgi:hypothetical protein
MKLFRGTAGTGTDPKPKTPAQLAREADVAREIAIKDAEAKARLDEIERAARFKREQEERERDRTRGRARGGAPPSRLRRRPRPRRSRAIGSGRP